MLSALRRKLAGVAVAGMLAIGFGVANASPASADLNQCFDGYYCQWEHSNYTGDFGQARYDTWYFGPMTDSASSLWNNRAEWATLYLNTSYTGECLWVKPRGWHYAIPWPMYDRFDSYRVGRHWTKGQFGESVPCSYTIGEGTFVKT
ncbi:peptidase inhibitor family I36 protein [Streptomyces sp. NPDC020681]|uniref:peptidase inhibitor family I36 protein n=1 Tax=Streptomyces sp. NPDC020681 TaxID=3365083 RepID=UPI003787824B